MTEQGREQMGEARVMTRAERNDYNGLTIEADTYGEAERQDFGVDYIRHDRPRTYYRVCTGGFGWPRESRSAWLRRGNSPGWLVKAALAVGLAGLAVLFFGFILPVLLVAGGLAVAGMLLWRFFH